MKKKIALIIVLVTLLVGGLIFVVPVLEQVEFNLLVRDWTIASIAKIKAGGNVPYDIDYNWSAPYNDQATWSTSGNSLYLLELQRKIVPYFEYEGITESAIYANAVVVLPLPGQKSFHNLGTAEAQAGVIRINERFIIDEWRLDARQMLSTMVHESAHLQGGNFLGGPPNWLEVSQFESITQSATVEIVASMCNHGNELACKAFWDEIYSYARGSFRMRLRRWGIEELYYPLARIFWWDDTMATRADKSLRYWMGDEERSKYLYTIIYQYQQRPWEDNVVAGLLGKDMPTGLLGKCTYMADGTARCEELSMSFDDTRYIVGDFLISFIDWLTP